jgi:hypothetical protein
MSTRRIGTSRAIVAAPNLHNLRAEAKTAARLESLPDMMKTAVAKVLQGETLEKAAEEFSIEKDISYSALQR